MTVFVAFVLLALLPSVGVVSSFLVVNREYSNEQSDESDSLTVDGALSKHATFVVEGMYDNDEVLSDLSEYLGYEPVLSSGRVYKNTGSCSSPIRLPKSFDIACKFHDLGYDMLRTMVRNGVDIPLGLRHKFDTLWHDDTKLSCSESHVPPRLCYLFSDVSFAVVSLNTFRQHGLAPVDESLSALVGTALGLPETLDSSYQRFW